MALSIQIRQQIYINSVIIQTKLCKLFYYLNQAF